MTIDKFLSFWSMHNTAIIEGLVALIIFLALFIAYRGFFGKKDGEASHEGRLDAAQLEKTLQKILENQGPGKFYLPTNGESATGDVSSEGTVAGASPEAATEIAQLKAALAESRKKAEVMAEKAKAAEEKVAAVAAEAGVGAVGAIADDGMSAKEKEDFAAKIRDLEARLAEYEIISEDIADLSRYREENEELRKEVETIKAGGGAPLAAAAVPPAAPVETAPIATAPPVAEEEVTAPEAEPPIAEVAAPIEAAPAADVPTESAASDVIDDDLMKEFAAAVENQQTKTLEKVAQKAGEGTEEAKSNGEETKQLMGEFENFVTKKS